MVPGGGPVLFFRAVGQEQIPPTGITAGWCVHGCRMLSETIKILDFLPHHISHRAYERSSDSRRCKFLSHEMEILLVGEERVEIC